MTKTKTKVPHGMKEVDLSVYVGSAAAGKGKAAKVAPAAPAKSETHDDFRARMRAECIALAKAGKSRKAIMDETGMGEFFVRQAIEASKVVEAAPAAPAGPRNREDWLNAVALEMAPWFAALGFPLTKFRVSIGFSSKGSKSNRVGECWTDAASVDAHHEIFIRPDQSDSVDVAAILAHELVHAAVGIPEGHGKVFKKVAVGLGLEGKMKATVPGVKFREAFAPILEKLGAIPHASLHLGMSSGPKKQTTRLMKCECPACEYNVRIVKKWAAIGIPTCPNPNCDKFGATMTIDGFEPGEEAADEEEGGGDE